MQPKGWGSAAPVLPLMQKPAMAWMPAQAARALAQVPAARACALLLAIWALELALALDNSDGFVNQQVEPLLPLAQLTAHGLLGQTHSARLHPSALRHIEGDVDDYVVNDLQASDFAFDRFGRVE